MKLAHVVVWGVISCLLVACGAQPVKPAATQAQSFAGQEAPSDPLAAARKNMEQKFLDQAEEAFRKGRFTAPSQNNAYDSFHSVLLLNPDNQQARSGLQAILIRYANMVRDAMAASRYGQARELLNQAQVYFPGNSLLLDLQKEVRQLGTRYQQTVLARPKDDLTLQEFELPPDVLSENRDQLLPFLASLAQRVKATDESIMIYARTDAEGRWIYQQMKKSVPGYRVRGDIRLAKDPKIAILPPL